MPATTRTAERPAPLDFGAGVIRDWARRDRRALVALANNRRIWRNMADRFPHPYTAADADRWLDYVTRQAAPTHWAIEVDGRLAGAIGVEILRGMYRHSATLGYWLGEPYWGRGIATAAVRAAVPAVLDGYGLVRLEARAFEWNPASMRVLERCGFTLEGVLSCGALKDGRLADQHLYAFVRRPADNQLPEDQ